MLSRAKIHQNPFRTFFLADKKQTGRPKNVLGKNIDTEAKIWRETFICTLCPFCHQPNVSTVDRKHQYFANLRTQSQTNYWNSTDKIIIRRRKQSSIAWVLITLPISMINDEQVTTSGYAWITPRLQQESILTWYRYMQITKINHKLRCF